nr:condensin-2 complex subunit G2-like isoform X2 [Lepeophtheirus salmonis]
MSSSRTSIRLKKKKSGVPSLDLAGPIPAETIDDIVATSGNSVEEFIGTFHGLGTKHLESFFKNLNKSQTLECWKNWSKLYTDQDPAIFSIFLNLIKSSLQDEKVVPPLHSIIKTINPLLSSDKYSDTIRNNILSICDRQFKDFISDQVFVSHLIIYLLRKNLDDNFSASTAKRIINVLTETRIMETLEPTLKPWILRTINEKSYYLNKEGIKCLAFVVVKSKYNYGNQFHEMTKSILPGMKIENIYAIGELYKKIWLKYTSSQRENFQQNCIQDLMYHGVLANRNLPKDYEIFPQILRLLDPLHQDKNNKNIQAMLYNLWEPILWRNLKAPNHNVRCNAAEFLFSAFPCENPFLNLEERTLVHDNQIKVMNDLLLDQEPSVRLIGVKGVCQVLSTYWAFLSSDSINELMMTLIKKSSRDSDSVQIRVAVLNGLSDIIKDAPSSHVYLKNILPKVGDSLRDVNEHVRLSMLDLLSIVKSVKYIAYWEICSLDDLLYCLSRDNSPAVCRRLVKLIFNSFFPMKEPESVKLERCVFLIEKNVSAANKFYKYSNKYMELVDSVKFMLTILVSFKRHLSVAPNFNSHQNSIEDDSFSNKENVDEEQPSNLVNSEQDISNTFSRVEADSFLSDFIIMDNFLDIITVMWISRYEDLLKEENTEYRAVLEKKTTKIMTNMFRVYKGTDMSRKIIYLCSLFSQKSVNTIVKYCLSSLKTCDFQALIEGGTKLDTKSAISSWKGNFFSKEPQNFSIFIDALCNWKKGQDLMELILYGIEKGFENINGLSLSLASSAKRRKSVRFIEKDDKIQLRSISFLTYVFRHSINKQRVTSENMKELKEIYIELSKIKDFVKREIEQNHFNEDAATEQYVLYTWETYLKTMLMVEDDNSVISSFVFEWLNYLRLSTSSSNLRSYVLCTFLLFLSNAFSLGRRLHGSILFVFGSFG